MFNFLKTINAAKGNMAAKAAQEQALMPPLQTPVNDDQFTEKYSTRYYRDDAEA